MRTRFLTLLTLPLSILAGCSGSTEPESCDSGDCSDDSGSTESEDRDLIAIGYDDALSVNQLHSIDVETGEVTTLLNFGFDVGWWYPGVISDSENGFIYCVSGSDSLYRFAMDGSSVEVVGTLSDTMQAMDMGPDGLIGIGYNKSSGFNVLRTVDTDTAEVSNVTSFQFDSGSWEVFVMNDIEAGELFATSTDHTLYRLQMDGSAVDAIGQFDEHVYMGLGTDGFSGISYNSDAESYEVVSMDRDTAEVTALTSFEWNTNNNSWREYVITDPDAGVFYALSMDQTLYRFQMDGSGIEELATIEPNIQAMGMGAY
jgi:myo-inositol-hexaphosphate 3-phosphohydrolase